MEHPNIILYALFRTNWIHSYIPTLHLFKKVLNLNIFALLKFQWLFWFRWLWRMIQFLKCIYFFSEFFFRWTRLLRFNELMPSLRLMMNIDENFHHLPQEKERDASTISSHALPSKKKCTLIFVTWHREKKIKPWSIKGYLKRLGSSYFKYKRCLLHWCHMIINTKRQWYLFMHH